MYAMTTTEAVRGAVDFKVEQANALHYWRKHPNLHGWMQRSIMRGADRRTGLTVCLWP
jgi:hypothetical protein